MFPIASIDLELPFIPTDKIISKRQILDLNKHNIDKIKQYVYYTFPPFEYTNIDHLLVTTSLL